MRRKKCLIATGILLVSLMGCSGKQALETDMTVLDMAAAVTESQSDLPSLKQITWEDEDFSMWLTEYYFISEEQTVDGVICYAEGVEASEIAILQMKEEKDCKDAEEALKEYLENRAGIFEGYAPKQAAMAKNGMVAVNGNYTALFICEDPEAAKTAFLNCFGTEGTRTETNMEKEETNALTEADTVDEAEAYDEAGILAAWQSGDDSALSEGNRCILNAAREVLEEEIDDSMSDYEKELAIHDWITGWSSFDYSVFGRSSSDGFRKGSDTPYGVFVEQSAMCHGYSSTFQLFMDMLDIECITVFGTPGSNGVEHSWNMVRLDGDWYCVDVAWDDPIGGSPGHHYFNVTSDDLRKGSIHHWEDGSVPEAEGTKYAYGNDGWKNT